MAPGHAGNLAVQALVAERFGRSGLTNGVVRFNAPAFRPGKTSIEIDGGPAIPIHPMHPTLVRPGNFTEREFPARLVYAGRGRFEDLQALDGMPLDGAILLMDFASGDNWMDFLRFGIRGVIFIGADSYEYGDASGKIYNTEARFPRFFIDKEPGLKLKEQCRAEDEMTITVKAAPSTHVMTELLCPWVLIPGADPELRAKEVALITAPMDGNCVVPALTGGARNGANLQLLLQLFEDFRKNPPARSVMLAAVNAHTQAFLGERMLGWHLAAKSSAVAQWRGIIADGGIRVPSLYLDNYAKLKLEPVDVDGDLLYSLLQVMRQLDEIQYKQREDEHKQRKRSLAKEIAVLKADGKDTQALEDALKEEIDPVLDLSVFTEADYRAAIDRAGAELEREGKGILKMLETEGSSSESDRADVQRLTDLKGMPFEELEALVNRVKSVFDDEKLFETWRVRLDASTGKRLAIKGPLQTTIKRELNITKMDNLDLSRRKKAAAKDARATAELDKQQQELEQRRRDLTRLLVLFNKVDIGVGRNRTYYHQIATNNTQRVMLKSYIDGHIRGCKDGIRSSEELLKADMANDSVREALQVRKVAVALTLDLDWDAERVGLFWFNPIVKKPHWALGFGRVAAAVARRLDEAAGGKPGPYLDALTNVGGYPQRHYFPDVAGAAAVFHSAGRTPAFCLRNAFAGPGVAFTPNDRPDHLNGERVHRLQSWARAYIRALLDEREITSAENIKPIDIWPSRDMWSIRLHTSRMDEYAASISPSVAVTNCILALYNCQPRDWNIGLLSLVDGDVVNCLAGLTGKGNSVTFRGLNLDKFSGAAYQLDERLCEAVFAIDVGRAVESGSSGSSVFPWNSKTMPMFPCREFPIYDRVDPSLIGATSPGAVGEEKIGTSPILVQTFWAKDGETKSDPVKYGTLGVRSLAKLDAAPPPTRGPASILIWRKKEGVEQVPLIVIAGKARCAVNATDEDPDGEGYATPEDLGPDYFAAMLRDMNTLNKGRMGRMRGVANRLVTDLLERGQAGVTKADRSKAENRHIPYIQSVAEGLGAQVKAYTQVRGMNADMLKAIMVYMALMLPFCYFLQKLLFNFVRLEHELLGFISLFLGTYVVFRLIHPAFAIAMNPEAIFIAFVLGATGCFITWVLHNRFRTEMQILFRSGSGPGEEVGYSAVGQTAMLIGVNNMKRRRIRTALTTATIVLVVFTMLAFSSVSKNMKPTLINQAPKSPYTGLFYHWPLGQPMDEDTADVFRTLFADRADVVVRRIMLAPANAETGGVDPWRVERGDSDHTADVAAAIGLTMLDRDFLGPMPILEGRYFSAADANEVMLPASAAAALQIKPADMESVQVRFRGRDLTVVGMVDDGRLRLMRDLDPALSLVPAKQGSKVGTSTLVDTSSLLLLPDQTARALGAGPFSISVRLRDTQEGAASSLWAEAHRLLTTTSARFHIGSKAPFSTGEGAARPAAAGIYYIGTSYRTSIGGLSRLIVPLLITGLIVFNTMLGTVHERKSEIAVYNAIGLNPWHIFMFFLAEALVYSVIGSIGGYLIGQVLAITIKSLDLVAGVNVNFSSLIVAYTIMFTIALVLLSTIYPGIVATRTAVPSGKRKWSMPDHDGQVMQLTLPFIYQEGLPAGVMYYLFEHYSSFTEQSLGDQIVTAGDRKQTVDETGRAVYTMAFSVALAPFDLGVTQEVTFEARYDESVQSYHLQMRTVRISGQDTNWVFTNVPFLERLRKLLLRWRNMDPSEHAVYVGQGAKLFAREPLLPAEGKA